MSLIFQNSKAPTPELKSPCETEEVERKEEKRVRGRLTPDPMLGAALRGARRARGLAALLGFRARFCFFWGGGAAEAQRHHMGIILNNVCRTLRFVVDCSFVVDCGLA